MGIDIIVEEYLHKSDPPELGYQVVVPTRVNRKMNGSGKNIVYQAKASFYFGRIYVHERHGNSGLFKDCTDKCPTGTVGCLMNAPLERAEREAKKIAKKLKPRIVNKVVRV
jgi:hypothetical protein